MVYNMEKRNIRIYGMILFIVCCFQINSLQSISVPHMEDSRTGLEEASAILPVITETDFNCLPVQGTSIRNAEGRIRVFFNVRARQNRYGMGKEAAFAAIVFAMVLFPYFIYRITVYLYGRCMIPLWKIINYIHLLDGQKEKASIRI
ncbi:MAG: hypothetical protein K2O02_00800 [Lachnospiraceae bacterium]|nr:hypothetical protein [Lachnospiraceae bacterium]